MKPKELKYYGLHACAALFRYRPQDIVRLYIHSSLVHKFKPLMKWCAQHKKAYHIVENEDLDRVSDSVHHEGICLLAKELVPLSADEFLASPAAKRESACFLYLDGVQNPHNVGSIMRSCAHFGITHILGEERTLPALSPSACRIAIGAAEVVRLVALKKAATFLAKLKRSGYALLATSSHGGHALYDFAFPQKSVLVMGGESEGVSPDVFALATHRLLIPGTGLVESLNVSVATSVCLSEYCRQHRSTCQPST